MIQVDLQGHGRTADIDRPISLRLLADDIAALIDHLDLDRPDVVGYSFGGGVAFWTAVRHPEKVGKLVMASAHVRRNAIPAEMLAQQGQVNAAAAEFMKDTPMYELYHRVAPHPENFGTLLDKVGAMMAAGLRLLRAAPRAAGPDPDRLRRRRHGPALALRRDVRDARRRAAGRRLDGRGPSAGRARAGRAAGPDPLQPRRLPLFAAVVLDFLR